MKELSVEEKAQRYDKAIKMAKSKIKNDKDHVLYEDDVIEIFPELKESEDEKIRKEILDYIIKGSESCYDVQQYGREKFEKWIAWFKKQGKWSEEDERNIKELLYLVEANYLNSEEPHDRLINFLESLKDRVGCEVNCITTWKPSEEQINILNEVFNFSANHESPHWNSYIFDILNNLIRQLKKLKE